MKEPTRFAEIKDVIDHREAARLLERGWIPLATRMIGEYRSGVPRPELLFRLGRPAPRRRKLH